MRGLDCDIEYNSAGSIRGYYRKAWLLPECVPHLTLQEPDTALTKHGNLCCLKCKDKTERVEYYSPHLDEHPLEWAEWEADQARRNAEWKEALAQVKE